MIHALHGNVGGPRDWEPLEQALGVPLDKHLLWEPEPDKSDSLSEWARRFIQSTPAGDILLGYSLGGRLALHALTESPNHWKAAIVISAHPGLSTEAERAERIALDREWSSLAAQLPWDEFLERWNAQSVLAGGGVLTQGSLEPWRNAIASGFLAWSLGRQEFLAPKLQKVATPVLWLTGGKDPKFTALADATSARMPNSRHAVLPDLGHRLHLENPHLTGAAIQDFLISINADPAPAKLFEQ